jgi:hypothetical protein
MTRNQKILYWSLTALIGLIFIGSAVGKLMPGTGASDMATQMGITVGTIKALGTVELISVLLFIFPRTGVLGTLLLTAYMGGAIATHVIKGLPLMAPAIIMAVLWLVAIYRFPELKKRISGTETTF